MSYSAFLFPKDPYNNYQFYNITEAADSWVSPKRKTPASPSSAQEKYKSLKLDDPTSSKLQDASLQTMNVLNKFLENINDETVNTEKDIHKSSQREFKNLAGHLIPLVFSKFSFCKQVAYTELKHLPTPFTKALSQGTYNLGEVCTSGRLLYFQRLKIAIIVLERMLKQIKNHSGLGLSEYELACFLPEKLNLTVNSNCTIESITFNPDKKENMKIPSYFPTKENQPHYQFKEIYFIGFLLGCLFKDYKQTLLDKKLFSMIENLTAGFQKINFSGGNLLAYFSPTLEIIKKIYQDGINQYFRKSVPANSHRLDTSQSTNQRPPTSSEASFPEIGKEYRLIDVLRYVAVEKRLAIARAIISKIACLNGLSCKEILFYSLQNIGIKYISPSTLVMAPIHMPFDIEVEKYIYPESFYQASSNSKIIDAVEFIKNTLKELFPDLLDLDPLLHKQIEKLIGNSEIDPCTSLSRLSQSIQYLEELLSTQNK